MSRDQKNFFVSEGLVTAEQRWALAGHRGWVVWLTGIDAPYEAAAAPDIHIRTAEGGIGDCVAQILGYEGAPSAPLRQSAASRPRSRSRPSMPASTSRSERSAAGM